mmetsp:Transcript_53682/g.156465  ORF Transcript_53682/g.156465 Transcript_53682/m.156465 type:complete len:242 (+) Transcript_53682:233-958(+)
MLLAAVARTSPAWMSGPWLRRSGRWRGERGRRRARTRRPSNASTQLRSLGERPPFLESRKQRRTPPRTWLRPRARRSSGSPPATFAGAHMTRHSRPSLQLVTPWAPQRTWRTSCSMTSSALAMSRQWPTEKLGTQGWLWSCLRWLLLLFPAPRHSRVPSRKSRRWMRHCVRGSSGSCPSATPSSRTARRRWRTPARPWPPRPSWRASTGRSRFRPCCGSSAGTPAPPPSPRGPRTRCSGLP